MRFNYLLLALCVTLAIGLTICVAPSSGNSWAGGSLRTNYSLPKLFSFHYFKSLFNKSYKSATEEAVRKKLFLANVFQAFVSCVSYKFKRSSYYFSVNTRSDWTQKEIDDSLSSYNALDGTRIERSQMITSEADLVKMADEQQIEKELERIRNSPADVELAEELNKLTLGQGQQEQKKSARKNFQVNKNIFESVVGDVGDPAQAAVTVPQPTEEVIVDYTKHPDYVEPGMKQLYSLDDMEREQPIPFDEILDVDDSTTATSGGGGGGGGGGALGSLVGGALDTIKSVGRYAYQRATGPDDAQASDEEYEEDEEESDEENDEDDDKLPDEVFVDHSKSGCMFQPQEQSRCGSCYAFAAIGYLEWALCKRTGNLIRLSEQYIVDCGSRTNLGGCNGGSYTDIVRFVHNLGLELAEYYPYVASEQRCPYPEGVGPKSMGYLRVDSPNLYMVPLDRFDEILRVTPIVIHMIPTRAFHQYGGGVHEMRECGSRGAHAVLIIGHGRQDGQEYWLIKNSYSVNWGENGYYKLNKNTNCIIPEFGFLYGMTSLDNIIMNVWKNPLVPTPVMSPNQVLQQKAAPTTNTKKRSHSNDETYYAIEREKRRKSNQQAGK